MVDDVTQGGLAEFVEVEKTVIDELDGKAPNRTGEFCDKTQVDAILSKIVPDRAVKDVDCSEESPAKQFSSNDVGT
jgi:hypothetical protein